MSGKRERNAYDIFFKLKVIAYAKENSNLAAERKYGVREKNVHDWRKLEEKMFGSSKHLKKMRTNPSPYEDLEVKLNDWVVEQLENGLVATRVAIRGKGLQLAALMGYRNFKASKGWCCRFVHRYDLYLRHQKTHIAQKLSRDVDGNQGKKADLYDRNNPDWCPTLYMGPTCDLNPDKPQPPSTKVAGGHSRTSRRSIGLESGTQVCSKHFPDGRLTKENPLPTLHMAYEKSSTPTPIENKKMEQETTEPSEHGKTRWRKRLKTIPRPTTSGEQTESGGHSKTRQGKRSKTDPQPTTYGEEQDKILDQYGGASDLSAADKANEAVMDTGAGPEPLGKALDCNTLMSLKYVKTETGGRQCIKCLHEFTQVDEFEDHLAACFCEDSSDPQENVVNETLKSEPDTENVGTDNSETFGFITMNSEIKQEPGVENLTSHYNAEFETTGRYSGDNFDAAGDFRIEQNFEVNESVADNPDGSMHDLDDFEIKVEPVGDETEDSMHDLEDFEIKLEVDEDAITDDVCERNISGGNIAGSNFQNVTASVEGTASNVSGCKLETNVNDVASECSMRLDDCDIKIEPLADGPGSAMHDLDDSMHNLDDSDIKIEVSDGVADYRNKSDEEATGDGLATGDGTIDDVSDHEMETNFDIASYTQTTFPDAAETDGGTGEYESNDIYIETQVTEENPSLQITGVFCNNQILNNGPEVAKTNSFAFVCPRCGELFDSHGTLATHACTIRSSQTHVQVGVEHTCKACHESYESELDLIEHEMWCGLKQSGKQVEWVYPKHSSDGDAEAVAGAGVVLLGAPPNSGVTMPTSARNIINRLRPLLPRSRYYDCFFGNCGVFFPGEQLAEYKKHLQTELNDSLRANNKYSNGMTLQVVQYKLTERNLSWPIITCNQPECEFMGFTIEDMKLHFRNTHSCNRDGCGKVCKNKHQLLCHQIVAHKVSRMKQESKKTLLEKTSPKEIWHHLMNVDPNKEINRTLSEKSKQKIEDTAKLSFDVGSYARSYAKMREEQLKGIVVVDMNTTKASVGYPTKDLNATKASVGYPAKDVNTTKASVWYPAKDVNATKASVGYPTKDANATKVSVGSPAKDANATKARVGSPAKDANTTKVSVAEITFTRYQTEKTDTGSVETNKTALTRDKSSVCLDSYIANLIQANKMKLSSPEVDADKVLQSNRRDKVTERLLRESEGMEEFTEMKHAGNTSSKLQELLSYRMDDLNAHVEGYEGKTVGENNENIKQDGAISMVATEQNQNVDRDETEKSFNKRVNFFVEKEQNAVKSRSKKSSRKRKVNGELDTMDGRTERLRSKRLNIGKQKDGVTKGEVDEKDKFENGDTLTADSNAYEGELHSLESDTGKSLDAVMKEALTVVESDEETVSNASSKEELNSVESDRTSVMDTSKKEGFSYMESNTKSQIIPDPEMITVSNPDLNPEITKFPDAIVEYEGEDTKMFEITNMKEEDGAMAVASAGDIDTPSLCGRELADVTVNTTPVFAEKELLNASGHDVTNVEARVEKIIEHIKSETGDDCPVANSSKDKNNFICKNDSCFAPAFSSSEELKRHIEEVHMRTTISCDIAGCWKQFAKVSSLVEHQMTFHVNRLQGKVDARHAQISAVGARNVQRLQGKVDARHAQISARHMQQQQQTGRDAAGYVRSVQAFVCKDAEGTIGTEIIVTADKAAQDDDANTTNVMYMCTVCSQVLNDSNQLQTHMMEHMHSCHLCSHTTKSYRELKDHLIEKHGVLPFQCQRCAKSFSSKAEVLSHVQSTHWELDTESLPYKCSEADCPKAFLFEKELFVHLKSHGMIPARKRNFKCRVKDCMRMFPTKNDLYEHIQTHSSR